MPNEVTLSVRTQLLKIVEELDKIGEKSREVSSNLKDAGKTVGDNLTEQSKKTTTWLQELSNVGRRVGDSLKDDFKALISLNALSQSMKLSSQFGGTIKETLELENVVKKLGASLGIAAKDSANFQVMMTKGLGEIGASSEEAAESLKGLRGTGIQGASNILGVSKMGVQLSSLGMERGKSGEITGSIAEILRAQGKEITTKNAGDIGKAVTKAMDVTGKSASDILGMMKETFSHMAPEMKKKTTAAGLSQMAIAETVGGPGASAALKKFLTQGSITNMALKSQGFGKIFTKEGGIDLEGLKQFSKESKRIAGDIRQSAQTYGLQEDEAQGLSNLLERTDQLGEALKKLSTASDDYAGKFQDNMSLSESFAASLNKVKGIFAGPLTTATEGMTKLLSGASHSTAGAIGVVAGTGIMAAMMARSGLGGIGKAMGMGGVAKGAIGGMIAKQAGATPVYVVNAGDIGGGSGALGAMAGGTGMMGKAGKFLGAAGMIGSAGLAGYEAGSAINEIPGVSDAIVKGFEKIAVLFGGGQVNDEEAMRRGTAQFQQQKVIVELNKRELKESKQPTRGASN